MIRTVVLACLFANSVFAQTLKVCDPRETCAPPPTLTLTSALPPFNAQATFGGETKRNGETYWTWMKTASAPACSAALLAERASYGQACRAAVGQALYQTQRFRLPANAVSLARFAAESRTVSRASAPLAVVYRDTELAEIPIRDESFTRQSGYAFARLAPNGSFKFAADGSRAEVRYSPCACKVGTFWFETFIAPDGTVPIPVSVAGPIENQRIAVTIITKDEVRRTVLEPTRLLDLPLWKDRPR